MRLPQPWCLPLPFVTEPFEDEILSSWMRRIGQEYGVSLEQMARHVGLSRTTPTDIDRRLPLDDLNRLMAALRVKRTEVCGRLLQPLRSPAQSLQSSRTPIQTCASCQTKHRSLQAQGVILRAWFEFWTIECQTCRQPMSSLGPPVLHRCDPAREHPNWFYSIMPAARRGAARLRAFAYRPYSAALSPVAALDLLSKPLAPGWRHGGAAKKEPHRVAELFVPGLAELTRDVGVLIPDVWNAGRPLRLVTARTILFAALASFLKDPASSMQRVKAVMPSQPGSALERWINALPPHSWSSSTASQQGLASPKIAANLELRH